MKNILLLLLPFFLVFQAFCQASKTNPKKKTLQTASTQKKIKIVNDFDKVIDCKVKIEDYYGRIISIRHNDKYGIVELPYCADTLNFSVIPKSYADYDSLIFDRCSDIPFTVKILSKKAKGFMAKKAYLYSQLKDYAVAGLIFKELSYREHFSNKKLAINYEKLALMNTAQALNFTATPILISNDTLRVTDEFSRKLYAYQDSLNLVKKNGRLTYETLETLSDKTFGQVVKETIQKEYGAMEKPGPIILGSLGNRYPYNYKAKKKS